MSGVQRRPFLLVDAFTDVALGGNPCSVVLDSGDLSPAEMQRLAREFNQSETAFVRRTNGGGFGVRFFTPAEEFPLAGHPTIAAVAALIHAGYVRLDDGPVALDLQLLEGPIRIDVTSGKAPGALPTIRMTQRRPVFGAVHDPAVVAPLFGLVADDVLPGSVVQTVSTGTPQLMMMLRDHAALRRASPPEGPAYARYRDASDFYSPHLFCLGGATARGQTFARHFGVPPDIPEDFVTGSATGGMAAYLWRYGHLASPSFVAEQGHWLGRPGTIDVQVNGPRDAIENVQVSGTGVVVVDGTLSA